MDKAAQRELRNVMVGLGACVAIALVLFTVFGPTRVGGSTIDVRAVFGSTDGITVGSSVQAAGVNVGEVADLTLVDDFRVMATLRIDGAVELDTDATAAIVTDGVFGGKLVRIDIGAGDSFIGDGGRINFTEDSIVLDDLLSLIIARARSARETETEQ
ncbi:MAG: hypothetical protein CL566_05795 [Alphaproteobacteria bacterium]|nr:hypothetical protein [Alphaproteobacteria bacterium]|tara:strand:+ start:111 stop:584 length:474 start_codon:yes stop_codon:yes gene_type:complete